MDKLVSCPVCSMKMKMGEIENHIDNDCVSMEQPKQNNVATLLSGNKKVQRKRTHDEPETPSKRIYTQMSSPDMKSTPPNTQDDEAKQLREKCSIPLAERLRPQTLNEYVGQSELVGPGGAIRGFIENDTIPSFILWGPPGVGKTSLARVIANTTSSRFVELSATKHNSADCRKAFEDARNELRLTKRRTILFCDEIHRFNKAQQDIFLPYVEKGDIVLVGATTENPSFQLNNALLSRARLFVLKKLTIEELNKVLLRAILVVNKTRKIVFSRPILTLSREAVNYLSDIADGDSRSALNLLELVDSHYATQANIDDYFKDNKQPIIQVTTELIKPICQRTHLLYDRVGDEHYDTISAFHKSVRGSDADAAIYYLARMINGGEDPLYIARRMIRIAVEDIGLSDPSCFPACVAAYQAVQFVGLPEADLTLVQCAVMLAQAPKSVKLYRAWKKVNQVLKFEKGAASAPIPLHLRNAPTKMMKELDYGKTYKYNPDFIDGVVKQDYMPDILDGFTFLGHHDLGDMFDRDVSAKEHEEVVERRQRYN